MVDNWFLHHNNAIGTVFFILCIMALLIAIISASKMQFFIFAFGLALIFLAIGSYYWHTASQYFQAKLQSKQ